MITSSGAICDVCGEYILPLDPEELIHSFNVEGIQETLHCDNKCKELLLSIGKEWQLLPTKGRLYQAFLEASK